MANRSHIPEFGNWETQDNALYTVVFDKARRGRPGTPMVNPNDPEFNQSVQSDSPGSHGSPTYSHSRNDQSEPARKGTVGTVHKRMTSWEDAGLKQFPDPSPNRDDPGRKTTWEPMHQRPGDRDGRSNMSDQSVARSPLHRQGRGRESPAWEVNRSYDNREGAPAKTRMKPANNSRNNENIDKAGGVPAFGVWNTDPSLADGYTTVFKKVKEDKHNPPRKHAEMPMRSPPTPNTNVSPAPAPAPSPSPSPTPKKGHCCFPWF